MHMMTIGKTWVVILSISLLIVGCRQVTQHETLQIPYIGSVESIADTLIMSDFEVLSFESNDNSLISKMDRVIKYDNRYYVLDKRMKQLLSFDSSGNHLFTINAVGNGIGEYISLKDFSIDREEGWLLLLVDPSAILYYDLEGRYDHKLLLDGYYNAITNDSQSIYLEKATYVNNELEASSVTIVRKRDGVMNNVLEPLPEIAPYCYYQGAQMSATNPLYFTRKFDDCVYKLSDAGLEPLYHIDWNKSTFPSSLKEKTYECGELNELAWRQNYIWFISDLQDSEENILFRVNLPGLFILSKRIRSVEGYKMIFNTLLDIPLPNYIPVGGDGNEVFFVYPVHILKEQIKDRNLSNKMDDLLESMDEDSNPLIFKYNLK